MQLIFISNLLFFHIHIFTYFTICIDCSERDEVAPSAGEEENTETKRTDVASIEIGDAMGKKRGQKTVDYRWGTATVLKQHQP